jgi:hypothetical protein
MDRVVNAPAPGERAPIQDGARVLADWPVLLERVQTLSGVSDQQFAATYQPLLLAWATYLQHLPDPAGAGVTLLETRLRQAEIVLARRRGVILPMGGDPEQAARQADVWTYAVFSVALLRQIGAALAPLAVALWSSRGQALGRWGPELQPRGLAHVRRAAAYSIYPAPAGASQDWTLLMAGALLPDTARNWLWREPAVFDLWQQALVAPALPAPLRGMFDGFLLTPPQGATS